MYDKLTSWDNLHEAFRKAAKGKRGRPAVAAFEYRLEENLLELRRELLDGVYTPGAYNSFYIHEPKRRLISAAPFRDRVVHHGLCNCMEPEIERSFIFDSYANRINKGTHRALDRAQEFSRKFRYVLQCDVRQFFPSIDHLLLVEILSEKLDEAIMSLVRKILKSGKDVLTAAYDMVFFPGDTLLAVTRYRGLPIGNLTSQFWANCYLNPFDHFVKRELGCPAYVRYVDDFMLFGNGKKQLWEWHAAIVKRMARLRLTIHPGAHPRPVTEGIPFLGFVVFPDRRRLKRRKGVHFRRRLQTMIEAYGDGQITLQELGGMVRSWVNHVRYANTIGLRKAIFAECPVR